MTPFQAFLLVLAIARVAMPRGTNEPSNHHDGHYAFEEVPGLLPPTVRKPPYVQTQVPCPGLLRPSSLGSSLCGNLNEGYLPTNPMDQAPFGQVYPFDLIRNKTLDYLSETLPILKEDSAIPKVAKFHGRIISDAFPRKRKRATTATPTDATLVERLGREEAKVTGRGFCDASDGIFCRFFSSFFPQRSGQPVAHHRNDDVDDNDLVPPVAAATPCPSKAEYVTPVFAKNYQGLWRYIVQIPYEGYLTQTVEVTRCLQRRCNFLDGRCLPTLRWTSLLAAEIFYPNAYFPTTPGPAPTPPAPHLEAPVLPPSVADFQAFQQYLVKRAGQVAHGARNRDGQETAEYCDGYDHVGCLQIRLFYDWFMVPGACKCWKSPTSSIFRRK